MQNLKIYGTLGPSCKDTKTIKKMIEVGMSGLRLNLSHTNLWEKEQWIKNMQEACRQCNRNIELLIDMQGPELRLSSFKDVIHVKRLDTIVLDEHYIPIEVLNNVEKEDIILIDDGSIQLKIMSVEDLKIVCTALNDGTLLPKKSIAIKGKSITKEVLSSNDLENLKCANTYGVNAIMQPFVREASDLIKLKKALQELHCENLKIYAKIENKEGFENLEEILPHCDMIVIARGDLGNAYGFIHLPIIQHKIETLCKKHKKPYMVVTQMLHSMIEHNTPTRAEVSDIFHAVYEGASSIMLTGECANGKYPVEAMEYFCKIANETLKYKGE